MSNDFGRFRTPDGKHEFDGIRLPDGSVRLLAATPPDPHKLRAAPTWKGAGMPTIADQKLTDNPAWWDAPLIDQRSHGSCFPGDTQVLMHDGSRKPIAAVVVGDRVRTAEGNVGAVTRTMVRSDARRMLTIGVGRHRLDLTPEHPVLTRRGYVPAVEIREDDDICCPTHSPESPRRWAAPTGWASRPNSGDVHNLSVSGDESYVVFATDLPDIPVLDRTVEGVGVHNCVGFSVSIAIMHKRARDGYATPKLSGAYLYSKVNGGRDAGAAISDGIDAAKQFGTCLEVNAPWDDIYPSRYDRAKCDAEALLYRVDDYWRLESPEDVLSALELGCTVGFAVQVNNDFMNLDADGVWGIGHGAGNHAVAIDGKYRHPKTRKWMFPNPMSWGKQVGMTGPPPSWLRQVEPNVPADLSGWGFFTLDHPKAVSFQEVFAIRSVAFGPDSDPGPPSPIA